jgi:hypothetical protein
MINVHQGRLGEYARVVCLKGTNLIVCVNDRFAENTGRVDVLSLWRHNSGFQTQILKQFAVGVPGDMFGMSVRWTTTHLMVGANTFVAMIPFSTPTSFGRVTVLPANPLAFVLLTPRTLVCGRPNGTDSVQHADSVAQIVGEQGRGLLVWRQLTRASHWYLRDYEAPRRRLYAEMDMSLSDDGTRLFVLENGPNGVLRLYDCTGLDKIPVPREDVAESGIGRLFGPVAYQKVSDSGTGRIYSLQARLGVTVSEQDPEVTPPPPSFVDTGSELPFVAWDRHNGILLLATITHAYFVRENPFEFIISYPWYEGDDQTHVSPRGRQSVAMTHVSFGTYRVFVTSAVSTTDTSNSYLFIYEVKITS